MTTTTVEIDAARYEDSDDCLTDAATDYAQEHGLAGWDLSPRWASEQRERIVLTVPSESIGVQ